MKTVGNIVPKEGFKCITIRAKVYDYYYANWLKNKSAFEIKGITSFSGYITHILTRAMEENNDC